MVKESNNVPFIKTYLCIVNSELDIYEQRILSIIISYEKRGYGHNMDKMSTNIDYNIYFLEISYNSGINSTKILLDKRNKRNIYIDRQNVNSV